MTFNQDMILISNRGFIKRAEVFGAPNGCSGISGLNTAKRQCHPDRRRELSTQSPLRSGPAFCNKQIYYYC